MKTDMWLVVCSRCDKPKAPRGYVPVKDSEANDYCMRSCPGYEEWPFPSAPPPARTEVSDSGDEHPLNQAIDRMIDRDRVSEADVLLAKVRDQCVSFPFADLHTAIEVHRANCHLQTGCPVLAAMERVAAEQSANSALRACPGCGRRFAMLYICTRCGRCDAQDLPRDADRAACCAGDDKCAEIDWRGEPRAGKELSL